jgi:crotonobetainyl-CoA:carnitine CoA-transferase CaiB-like acyl-CoA transferase
VPAGAVVDYQQLGLDPQLNARGAFREVMHPAFGREVRATSQWSRGDSPQPIDLPAPCFGQHNEAILTGILGMTPDAVTELEREGVISDQIKAAAD